MEEKPLVSVCIASYNHKDFLKQTLHSILQQSYKKIEILVGDSGSTENIQEVVESFCDPRLRYIKYPPNNGTLTFNYLAKEAQGDLLAMYHHDDIYLPTIIEDQVNAFQDHRDIAAVTTLGTVIDEHGNEKFNHLIRIDKIIQGKDMKFDLSTYLNVYLRHSLPFANPTLMVKKQAYLSIHGYREDGSGFDFDLYTRLLEKYKVMVLNKRLFLYRNHSGQGGGFYNAKTRTHLMPDIGYLYQYVLKNKVKLHFSSWVYLGLKYIKDSLIVKRNQLFLFLKGRS